MIFFSSSISAGNSGIITGASTTITIGKPVGPETNTISSFRSPQNVGGMSTSIEMSTNNSSVYLSPFADTVSPVKPPLLHHQSLPRRKSAISMPSPTPDPKQLSNTNSRDPLLLFQDLGASGGGSLTRRNPMPPPDTSPPSRSFDPSFFTTSYPIDGRRSAEPFGALFFPSKSSTSHHRPSSSDLVRTRS